MDKTRRQILKLLASAPLILPLGLTASPIMRYLKPTMSPLGFFDKPDFPGAREPIAFELSDFTMEYMCIPFTFQLSFTEFSPAQSEIREIPAFMIQLEKDHFVAYSRICPFRGCVLNWLGNPSKHGCGCADSADACACFSGQTTPVLACPCDLSIFDLVNDGRVIRGPAWRPPRKFDLRRDKERIAVVGLENFPIA